MVQQNTESANVGGGFEIHVFTFYTTYTLVLVARITSRHSVMIGASVLCWPISRDWDVGFEYDTPKIEICFEEPYPPWKSIQWIVSRTIHAVYTEGPEI